MSNHKFVSSMLVSVWLLFIANSSIFAAPSWQEQVNFQWYDGGVLFVLDQRAYGSWSFIVLASSLKQQSADRRHMSPHSDSESTSLCSFSLMLRS